MTFLSLNSLGLTNSTSPGGRRSKMSAAKGWLVRHSWSIAKPIVVYLLLFALTAVCPGGFLAVPVEDKFPGASAGVAGLLSGNVQGGLEDDARLILHRAPPQALPHVFCERCPFLLP